MTKSKIKLYDEERHFIGETTIEIPSSVTVIFFGQEAFVRSDKHENCFQLSTSIMLKNGEVTW